MESKRRLRMTGSCREAAAQTSSSSFAATKVIKESPDNICGPESRECCRSCRSQPHILCQSHPANHSRGLGARGSRATASGEPQTKEPPLADGASPAPLGTWGGTTWIMSSIRENTPKITTNRAFVTEQESNAIKHGILLIV